MNQRVSSQNFFKLPKPPARAKKNSAPNYFVAPGLETDNNPFKRTARRLASLLDRAPDIFFGLFEGHFGRDVVRLERPRDVRIREFDSRAFDDGRRAGRPSHCHQRRPSRMCPQPQRDVHHGTSLRRTSMGRAAV